MLSGPQIAADLAANWPLYLSMPFVAAAIGYGTKVVAIRMMFEPVAFVGSERRLFGRRLLGWQGIVPRRAAVMAEIACDTMTRRLLSPEDVFGRLEPAQIAHAIEQPLLQNVEEITQSVAATYAPGLWEAAPEALRQRIVRRLQEEAPDLVRDIMLDLQRNIRSIFDLKQMVVSSLLRDPRLLNRIFLEAGAGEFRFIRRSGLWFGFAIGCVQAVVWALTHNAWVMPLFGLFTGWFTDWLALRMIFHPKQPTRYLGLFEWQGLFLRRRLEVSAAYGRLIAAEIITPRNVIDAIVRGPASDRLFALVQRQVQRMVDEQAGLARPFVVIAVGSARYQEMKQRIAGELMQRLPATLRHVEAYAGRAMDLENLLVSKMKALTAEEFEALLHPAFEQDEWILIAVGAALGFLVGELQVLAMHALATPLPALAG